MSSSSSLESQPREVRLFHWAYIGNILLQALDGKRNKDFMYKPGKVTKKKE